MKTLNDVIGDWLNRNGLQNATRAVLTCDWANNHCSLKVTLIQPNELVSEHFTEELKEFDIVPRERKS